VRAFEAEFGMALDVAITRANEAETVELRSREAANAREAQADALAARLTTQTDARLTQLRDWRLTHARPDAEPEAAIAAIAEAVVQAANVVQGQSLEQLHAEQTSLLVALHAIATELREVEDALAEVEMLVIGEALVVATTLTRAYKRESVQARRFDTVILDEASMAPIPALWVVAGLAEANVVVVGDFKQLPPIKHSEHPLAEQWLGQDIFRASGVQGAWEAGEPPENLVQLQVQYRMDPQISARASLEPSSIPVRRPRARSG
jgi:hypothetical protein